jgi:hypothetical protein
MKYASQVGAVSTNVESTPHSLVEELRELVEALDRRVPRLERAGETAIAGDAARLRDEAIKRLAALNRNGQG